MGFRNQQEYFFIIKAEPNPFHNNVSEDRNITNNNFKVKQIYKKWYMEYEVVVFLLYSLAVAYHQPPYPCCTLHTLHHFVQIISNMLDKCQGVVGQGASKSLTHNE